MPIQAGNIMSFNRPFKQVDVFTSVPLLGNPVAVVLDGAGLSDDEMQRFANWTNLSETTFVTPPTQEGADYAVRIWTPKSELPFAGHPTLGTAFAVLEAGIAHAKNDKLFQECAVGLVELSVPDDWRTSGLSFRLPCYSQAPASDGDVIIAALGGAAVVKDAPVVIDVGPHWVIAQMVSAQAVTELVPDLNAIAAYNVATNTTGVTVFAEAGDGLIVRSFAPTDGLIEDPVCGSGNGAVAAYRLLRGAIKDGSTYTARQGAAMGRDGYVQVRVEGSDIHIGGACVTCVEGIANI
jgi:PhzF family phenazine biosynthesis protein